MKNDKIMPFIGMTQKIIERFTVQSFAIKGFGITYIGIITNVVSSNATLPVFITTLVSIMVFWYLDSFYLRMEKIYRNIETYARFNPKNSLIKNFVMSYEEYPEYYFDNGTKVYIKGVKHWDVAKSKTIFPIYIGEIFFVISLYDNVFEEVKKLFEFMICG